MKDRVTEMGAVVWFSILALVVIAILAFGTMAMNQQLMPWQRSIERNTTESSKSFIDSTNTSLMNFKTEYVRLDTKIVEAGDDTSAIKAYQAQQGAIFEQMCSILSTMKSGTARPEVSSFVSQHGGC